MTHVDWDCSLDTWRDVLPLCPEATFFHTPEWYLARAGATGVTVRPVAFRFADGSRAVLPLAVRERYGGLLKEAVCGLENGYGGLLAPQPLRAAQIEDAYRRVRRRYPELRVVGNPHVLGPQVPDAADRSMDVTHVLRLAPPDELLAGYAPARARHVREAQAAGLRVEVVEGLDVPTAERLYPLYAEFAATWRDRRWRRDAAYFRALARRAGRHLTIFLAYRGSQVVGLHLVGAYPPVAVQLHLATDSAVNRFHPASLLVHEALVWCHRQGFSAFDFLASDGRDGVQRFKASFGAEPRAYPLATQTGWAGEALHTARLMARAARPRLASAT